MPLRGLGVLVSYSIGKCSKVGGDVRIRDFFCGSATNYWSCFSVIHWQVLSTCILAGCEACWCQWAVCQSCCVASLAGHHKFWKFRWHLFALKAVPARKCQASEVSLTLCEVRSVFSSARHSFAALCLRLKTLQHWQAPVLLLCQHECC